jgi:ParB/RepB/Spo0J family partition protein
MAGKEKKMNQIPLSEVDEKALPEPARFVPEDEGEWRAFCADIKNRGLLCPVTVGPKKNGRYPLIAGRRRLRAMRELGASTIAAIVLDKEKATSDTAVAENWHRKQLLSVEKCFLIAGRVKAGEKIADIAKSLSLSPQAVGNWARVGRAGFADAMMARAREGLDIPSWRTLMGILEASKRYADDDGDRASYENAAFAEACAALDNPPLATSDDDDDDDDREPRSRGGGAKTSCRNFRAVCGFLEALEEAVAVAKGPEKERLTGAIMACRWVTWQSIPSEYRSGKARDATPFVHFEPRKRGGGKKGEES